MNTSEVKEKIIQSINPEFYSRIKVVLNYPPVEFTVTLEGVSAIFEFVTQQIEGFKSYGQIPSELDQVVNVFTNVKNNIETLLNGNNATSWEWDQRVKNQLENPHPAKFVYQSPNTEFLIKLYNEHRDYYVGAYEYLSQLALNNVNNKNQLTGFLLAYEFTHKDSKITEKKEAEKRSLSKLRNDFEKYLGESESHLNTYLANANQIVIDRSKQIDEFLKNTQEGYDGWFNQSAQDFSAFYNASNERIKTLENLYQEKLKLEAPAKYWNDRAKKLRNEGYWWLTGLIACIGIGVVVLMWILNMIAEGTLTKIFASTATAIKWSVALITLISFIAYAIRIISKLTFSAFHLVRDAEEREQLTYVYLALQKEKGIDQTERHLIMQSLFSRADTGLLKDDASPTMPGNIVDKFITK
jgi:hypothetical protein